MNRFDRALGILLMLREGHRISAGDLAAQFDVSIRTIYRDIDVLGTLGVRIVAEPGRNGGFRLQPGYFLPPVMFSPGEAISLILGATMLRSLRTRPFAADLDSGEEKLVAAMPAALRAILADARSVVGFEGSAPDAFHAPEAETTPWTGHDLVRESQTIEVFLQSVLQRRMVEIRYSSPYRATESRSVVSPLGILADRDLWYLVGRKRDATGEPRMWRADRVLEIRSQTRSAGPDPSFDVRRLLNRAWLRGAMAQWAEESPVRIRVTPGQITRLRQDWYYSRATFSESPDGRFEMTLGQDNPAMVLDLIRWLGPGAELIEPVAWRSMLAAELAAMANAYD